MPWPSSAVNSGPRRLSQAHGITETCRNSQPTCSAASCSSPADRPDVQSQAKSPAEKKSNDSKGLHSSPSATSMDSKADQRWLTVKALLRGLPTLKLPNQRCQEQRFEIADF